MRIRAPHWRNSVTAEAAAEADILSARSVSSATTAATRGALATARARYEAARERLASYDAALLLAAREERTSALAAYRDGALTLLDLLDFERALAQAEIGRLRTLLDGYAGLASLLSGTVTSEAGSKTNIPSATGPDASTGGREP